MTGLVLEPPENPLGKEVPVVDVLVIEVGVVDIVVVDGPVLHVWLG